jgi:hypothetical protein
MNSDELAQFNQAVALAQAGNKSAAYSQLKALARANGAKDYNLLLWLAFTTPDLAEAETAIDMADIAAGPGNPGVTAARNWLVQEKYSPARPAPTFSPVTVTPPPPPHLTYQSTTPYQATSPQFKMKGLFLVIGWVVIILVIIGVVASLSIPSLISIMQSPTQSSPTATNTNSGYKTYSSDREMVNQAASGEQVKLSCDIAANATADNEIAYSLPSVQGQPDVGIILRIPPNKTKLSFKAGQNVYYGKVIGRQLRDNPGPTIVKGLGSRPEAQERIVYLVIEIEQVSS